MKAILLIAVAFALGLAASEKWRAVEASADAADALEAKAECEGALQNVLNHSRVVRRYDQATGFSVYRFASKRD